MYDKLWLEWERYVHLRGSFTGDVYLLGKSEDSAFEKAAFLRYF
jgi:hypothetical protein